MELETDRLQGPAAEAESRVMRAEAGTGDAGSCRFRNQRSALTESGIRDIAAVPAAGRLFAGRQLRWMDGRPGVAPLSQIYGWQ